MKPRPRGRRPVCLPTISRDLLPDASGLLPNPFLAVMDAKSERRVPLHVDLLLDAPSLEAGLRASAREYAEYARQHPGWTVYVEFWTHAARRPELRRKVAERHERLLDAVTELVEEFARRWGVEFTIPTRKVVCGIYALSHSMGPNGWWTPRPPRWASSS